MPSVEVKSSQDDERAQEVVTTLTIPDDEPVSTEKVETKETVVKQTETKEEK